MAIDIFDQGFSDHVVFDRIVDCDRTITLARQAADKAEEKGQHEKAAALRAKADYLEEILQNTQNPDYSDEEDGTPPASAGENSASGTPTKANGEDNSNEKAEGDGESVDSKDSDNGESLDDSEGASGGSEEETKQPEDLADLDSHNGKHSGGTNKTGGGGPSDNSGEGSGGGSADSASGSSKSNKKQNNNGKEFDPFKTSFGQGNQSQQITPEQELEAIIKRLSNLTGEAKKGADRGLQDFFNQITGGDSL